MIAHTKDEGNTYQYTIYQLRNPQNVQDNMEKKG
jgi:hypothetical protein